MIIFEILVEIFGEGALYGLFYITPKGTRKKYYILQFICRMLAHVVIAGTLLYFLYSDPIPNTTGQLILYALLFIQACVFVYTTLRSYQHFLDDFS